MPQNVIIAGSPDLHRTPRQPPTVVLRFRLSQSRQALVTDLRSARNETRMGAGCVEIVPYRLQLVPEVGLEPTRRLTDPRV